MYVQCHVAEVKDLWIKKNPISILLLITTLLSLHYPVFIAASYLSAVFSAGFHLSTIQRLFITGVFTIQCLLLVLHNYINLIVL
jgi:hypothetical protein